MGPAHAQHNDVERRNPDYLWLEAVGHPNGNSFPDVRQNPPAHQLVGGGVANGTLSYVWIPAHANDYAEDEIIDGFRAPLGPSSATTVYPSFAYYPEVTVHRTRAVGNHVEPDVAAAPYFVMPETSLVFPAFGYYESGVNLLTPYVLDKQQKDVVLSLKWNRNDSRWKADTLQMWGDAYSNVYSEPVFGFVAPSGAVTPIAMTGAQPGHLNFTYRRGRPSVAVRSDWGRGFNPMSVFPGLYGYSISTYEAPLASVPGQIGWDVRGGLAHAGGAAVALLDVGPVFGGSSCFSGQRIEVDVLNPALPVLASAGYVLPLDASGFARGPLVPVPSLGVSAIGTYVGAEFVLVDVTGTVLTGSTQAGWVLVQR